MLISPVFASDSGKVTTTDSNLLINQDLGLQGIQKIPSGEGCNPLFIIQYPQPPTNTTNMNNSGQTFKVEGDICPGWNFPNNPKGNDNGEIKLTTDGPLTTIEPTEINNIIPENNHDMVVSIVSLGAIVLIGLFMYFKKWRFNIDGTVKTKRQFSNGDK